MGPRRISRLLLSFDPLSLLSLGRVFFPKEVNCADK
jgi:hypothetical protein